MTSPRPEPPSRLRIFLLAAIFALVSLVTSSFWFSPRTSLSDLLHYASSNTSPMTKGKLNVGYFVNWGIYGRKFPPQAIPVEDLTHILYAFANVRSDGEVFLSDDWADKDIHYPGDSWNDSGNNLYGNFKQIYLLKKRNRHLKTLLSIGGWTYSQAGCFNMVVNPSLRAKFVQSSVKLLENFGLDGIDIDYEYPSNHEQAVGYADLLRELRHALDEHARKKGTDYRFLLTIAAPCGPDHYHKLQVQEMDRYLDFWNMMTYDFAGSWDSVANHQANVHGGPLSASKAIHWYISQGVDRSKIIMGLPLYGRSFANTEGPGKPFSGIGQGSWEKGVYDYRALPLPGASMFRDEKALASWSYDYETREMISFDSEEVAAWKAHWIKDEGLGGAMVWELSGDKGGTREGMEGGPGKEPQPGKSIVKILHQEMGHPDREHNWLRYDESVFDNMRQGME
ncbi:Glyco-18 domain-containing protein [Mycena kentingensis (nom. inval.)]|nr:Glyco-18 domain-containing protein [Mycena kentingensis (nom. inval.)]